MMGENAGLSPETTRVVRECYPLLRADVAFSLLVPLLLIVVLWVNHPQALAVVSVSRLSSHPRSARNQTLYWPDSYDSSLLSSNAPAPIGFGQQLHVPGNRSGALFDDAFDAPRPARERVPAADIAADGSSLPGLAPQYWTPAGNDARAPGYYQTSEFMFGTVAVGIVFPQCNGAVDRCTEVWTPAAVDQVVTQIKAGTDWWVKQMHERVSFALYPENPVPTAYEPIQHSQLDEKLWIADVMTRLGFRGSDYFEQVYAYNNSLRQKYGTDWAFTIFVADGRASARRTFSNGHFSYSYVPGPFTVETYDNGSYTINNMAAVIAHETGHIFGALDEYASAKIACTATSGYITLQNQNSEQNCASNVDSIMRGGLAAYVNRLIDPYALGMVGQRVSGTSDLPDPINTMPLVVLDPIPSTLTRTDPTITGTAQDIPYGSLNDHAITINYVTKVQYRIDGGAWQPASPSDDSAAFHNVKQGFTFTPSLSPGHHVVELQATNRVGHSSPIITQTLTVEGTP